MRAATAPPNVVYLDTLDLTTWQQRRQRPRARLSLRGKPITMNGIVYPHGVGTLTINEFLVDVSGEAEKFVAMVGIDDEMKTSRGTANFEVWADDKLVASSGVMHAGQAPILLVANLKGAKIVQLITDDGQDTSNDDNADWGGALFYMKAGSTGGPVPYVLPPDAPAVISMTTKAEPSINGPRITGATPGRPFLFRVPATGDGPLTYSARNLPSGVSLDPKTGIIAGSLTRDGTTVVDLTVRGAKGTASRQLTIVGGKDKLALTPPLGWNSWNAWGTGVDAEKVKSSAIAMEKSGLVGHGFQYVNIDDGWEGSRAADGELPANAIKFPDMKGLGDFVHGMGLKFGIYSSPGPSTCGGRAGSYQHELQDARTWARWGVDLLKHDYCSYENIKPGFDWPTLQAPYIVMRQALDSLDRDMIYSIGNYGYGEAWKWAGDIGGELWRTTGDLTDSWSNLESVGFRQAGREPYAGPGRWNDTDMLVVGNVGLGPALHPTKLTQNEQVLHLTLWSMQAAPLLIGADMSHLDAFTIALLTNDEVLDVDQDMLGKAGGRVWKSEKLEVWSRPLSDGTIAVALFNRGLMPAEVTAKWTDVGATGRQAVRDLWLRKELGIFAGSFKTTVPRHGAVMVKIGTPGKQ
ncbi:MAG: NPCBM/NEW2 domain-containing protein [Gemmatimonas sp.]